MDVAQALTNLISIPSLPGTLSLPGPSTLTYAYILDLISTVTYNAPSRAPVVPKPIANLLAKVSQNVWWPVISPDEVTRRYLDDVGAGAEYAEEKDEKALGDWDKVGVVPDEMENHAITYLRRYRSAYVLFYELSGLCSGTHLVFPCPSNRVNFVRPIVLPPRPVVGQVEEY